MLRNKINNITDIIDIEYLQTVQDSLGQIVGITTTLHAPNGAALSKPTNLQAFCKMMQASPEGYQMCINTHQSLIDANKKTGELSIITCPNTGLKGAGIPIFFEGQYLGSWIIGQIRMEDVDASLIERTAKKAGVSEEDAKENIAKLPILSPQEFENILNFLVTTTQTITDIAAVNTMLNRQNHKLAKLANNLDNSLAAFKEFINLTDIGTYLVDYETGKLIMGSSAYKEIFGVTDEDFSNHTCFHYMGHKDFCPFCPKSRLLDENGNPNPPYVWELYNENADLWLNITSRALKWIDGRMVIMATFVNITEHKREEERIAYLAYNDQQLNIPNALKLNKDINEKYNENAYLFFFDIKGLKNINNVYGRAAGDALLNAITSWFGEFVDDSTTLYRINGDVFGLLVENSNEEEIIDFSNTTFSRFDSPWIVDMDGGIKQRIYSGIQLGIIQVTAPVESYSTLLNLVEKVLSFAIKANRPILFDEQMDQQYREHMELIVSLKSCVLNDMEGFSLNYQPVVDAKTGNWIGMEALCRWNSPDVGNVSPNIFIQEAEQLGIISTIGYWVLEEAVRQTKQWKLDKLTRFSLSVNLSPIQLRDKGLITNILHILEKYDYPAEKFHLEITESAEIQFDEITLNLLSKLKSTGIKLSLDDFGTGYATFSNLKNLPISVLKTDRSFIIGIEEDEYLQHTLRTMVELAHFAGLTVTTEGVETARQYEIVKENGANNIQGYYFSRPLSNEMMEEKLHNFK